MVAGIYTVHSAIHFRQYYEDTKNSPVVGSAGFGKYRQGLPATVTLNNNPVQLITYQAGVLYLCNAGRNICLVKFEGNGESGMFVMIYTCYMPF